MSCYKNVSCNAFTNESMKYNIHFATKYISHTYLTKKYNISSSTLNRLFNDNLQTSPKLFLETKRLAHSRKLLREGNSVMDACMKSGFPDYSNYIRLFKKRFNMTPNQYKNQK